MYNFIALLGSMIVSNASRIDGIIVWPATKTRHNRLELLRDPKHKEANVLFPAPVGLAEVKTLYSCQLASARA